MAEVLMRTIEFDPSLERYLERVLDQPWGWAEMDCVQFVARWIEARTGRAVLDADALSYATPREALGRVRRAGGMLPLVGGYLARAGLARTTAPEHGDVGLVRVGCGPLSLTGEACVIRYATRWVGRAHDGLSQVELEPYACWRVE